MFGHSFIILFRVLRLFLNPDHCNEQKNVFMLGNTPQIETVPGGTLIYLSVLWAGLKHITTCTQQQTFIVAIIYVANSGVDPCVRGSVVLPLHVKLVMFALLEYMKWSFVRCLSCNLSSSD